MEVSCSCQPGVDFGGEHKHITSQRRIWRLSRRALRFSYSAIRFLIFRLGSTSFSKCVNIRRRPTFKSVSQSLIQGCPVIGSCLASIAGLSTDTAADYFDKHNTSHKISHKRTLTCTFLLVLILLTAVVCLHRCSRGMLPNIYPI